jgi:hypothetical protein
VRSTGGGGGRKRVHDSHFQSLYPEHHPSHRFAKATALRSAVAGDRARLVPSPSRGGDRRLVWCKTGGGIGERTFGAGCHWHLASAKRVHGRPLNSSLTPKPPRGHAGRWSKTASKHTLLSLPTGKMPVAHFPTHSSPLTARNSHCPKPSSSIDVQNDDFRGGAYTLAGIVLANVKPPAAPITSNLSARMASCQLTFLGVSPWPSPSR